MTTKLLVGIAAGVGVALFLNSKKGQAMVDSLCDSCGEWMKTAKDTLQDSKDKVYDMAEDAKKSARSII